MLKKKPSGYCCEYIHIFQLPDFSVLPHLPLFFLSKNSASPQSGPERATGPDLDFMEEIEELAKEFIDTTEKAMALEKLWEESSRLSGKQQSFQK